MLFYPGGKNMSIEKVQEAMGLGSMGPGFKKHGARRIADEGKARKQNSFRRAEKGGVG
jgi:hypothetical protein